MILLNPGPVNVSERVRQALLTFTGPGFRRIIIAVRREVLGESS